MSQAYNIAVIGCGYWGPNLLRNFYSIQDSKVKKVCDIDSNRLAYIKNLYKDIEITSDFSEIIDDKEIDAVVIATPVSMHYKIAKDSLESGKHVLIEKPMAQSSNQCKELIEIANNKHLKIMIGHTFIYTPAVRKIKEIINKKDLGEIYYINSQRLNLGLFQKDINVAWDLAPHDISIIQYILNQKPISVNCQGKANVTDGIEDITNMTVNFSGGGFATIQSSWLDPNKIRRMTFVGSKRMLVYDDNEPLDKIKIYDKRVETPPYYDTFGEFQYSYHYGDMYAPYLKQIEPLKFECQHFLDCIKNGGQSESSGIEGLMVVQILEAASESLKNGGKEIKIDN